MTLPTFTIDDIRAWRPCYDPARHLTEDWSGTALDMLRLEHIPPQDRLWVVLRPKCLDDRTIRMFAVECARSVQHLMTDPRSIATIGVAERYANGEATEAELAAARDAARAAWDAASAAAARDAASAAAARDAARAAWDAASAASAASAARAARAARAAWAASDAARAAAWDTAWDAAWDTASAASAASAASDAASDAARAAQVQMLLGMLKSA